MRILKNKTYNLMIVKIKFLEQDRERLLKKCDFIQMDFNGLSGRFELQRDEIKNQKDIIFSLNERVQKAEVSYEKLKELFGKAISENSKLMSEKLELESKLSRKGLGTKGKKKEQHIEVGECFAKNSDETIFIGVDLAKEGSDFTTISKVEFIDESQITEVEFEEQKYVEITSTEQLEEYIGSKFECFLSVDKKSDNISGKVCFDTGVIYLCFNNNNVGWEINGEVKTTFEKAWGVFNEDFGTHIKSLKILL